MKRFLAPILLLVLLFPTLALGGEVPLDDLVLREIDGLYFKKFTEVPFTGKVTGKEQGSVKDGIGVVAVKNGLDTSSSTGKMMMKMIGVMEEWNREMLVERTKSGLDRTRANGTKLGRKKITNPKMTAQIISLRNENKSIRAIATEVGVSTATIQRELRKVA